MYCTRKNLCSNNFDNSLRVLFSQATMVGSFERKFRCSPYAEELLFIWVRNQLEKMSNSTNIQVISTKSSPHISNYNWKFIMASWHIPLSEFVILSISLLFTGVHLKYVGMMNCVILLNLHDQTDNLFTF